MNWIVLVIAGLFEVLFAFCLGKAKSTTGKPFYHTNILLCIGEGFATICLDSIPDKNEIHEVVDDILPRYTYDKIEEGAARRVIL